MNETLEKIQKELNQLAEAERTYLMTLLPPILKAQHDLEDAYAAVRDDRAERAARPRCSCGAERSTKTRCAVHPVTHFWQPTCCTAERDQHRVMTSEEVEQSCPIVFEQVLSSRDGTQVRLSARFFWQDSYLVIVRCFAGEDTGITFDLRAKDLPALQAVLREMAASTSLSRSSSEAHRRPTEQADDA